MNPENLQNEPPLAEKLHNLIAAIEASGHVILPHTNLALLQSIVEAAARIFGAVAAAIALITEDGQELEFKVAYNVINQNIIGQRFPLNSGIAGYVATTGQPLTVSSADQDERFNRSFAEQSGYIPKSILTVPLVLGEQVIGVIQALDKTSGETFGPQDIALMTLFAQQAALAIGQSQQLDQLQSALIEGLKQAASAEGTHPPAELIEALNTQPPTSKELISLAKMIKDISALGQAERDACLQILRVFQTFSRTKLTHQLGARRL